jgi:hypothetical protein
VRRVDAAHHVPRPVGGRHAQPALRGRRRIGPLLEPHLVEAGTGEPAEQADAVAGREDLLHVVEPAQPLVDPLPHRERRHRVERDRGDDPERAERDGGDGEDLGIRRAVQRAELAVGGHQLDRGDGRGEDPVAVPGAVGAGRAGPGHGDVRQRPEVVQGEPGGVEPAGHLAEPQAGRHRDGAGVRVDPHRGREPRDGHEVAGRVGDPVERVPGAERADPLAAGHQLLQLRHAVGPVEPPRPEDDVACPVRPAQRGGHSDEPTEERPEQRPLRCPARRAALPGTLPGPRSTLVGVHPQSEQG